jgi:hypothetical protein
LDHNLSKTANQSDAESMYGFIDFDPERNKEAMNRELP